MRNARAKPLLCVSSSRGVLFFGRGGGPIHTRSTIKLYFTFLQLYQPPQHHFYILPTFTYYLCESSLNLWRRANI